MARSLLAAMPIEQDRPVARRTLSLIRCAEVERFARHLRQVDVDLVDAAIFDVRGDLGDRGLETAGNSGRTASKSAGSRIASGAKAAAFISPMPECTPKARAS